MHIVDVMVACVALVMVLLCCAVLARQRFMLRTDGAVPVAFRPSEASRWQYGVARYAGSELRWYRSLGVGTRPSRVLHRSRLRLINRRGPASVELQILPATAVVVECRDGGAPLFLALGEGAYTGFVSWLEASAPAP